MDAAWHVWRRLVWRDRHERAKGARCADAQKTLRAAQERLNGCLRNLDLGRDPGRVRVDGPSSLGEAQLARGAIEKPRCKRPLEPGYVLARRRSGHAETSRRGREAAGLHNLRKNQHIERIEHLDR